MMDLTASTAWHALLEHYNLLRHCHMRSQFEQDSNRFKKFSLSAADLFLDYSKNRIDNDTLNLLCRLADTVNLKEKINLLFTGKYINYSTDQPVLHTLLRNGIQSDFTTDLLPVYDTIQDGLNKIQIYSDQIRENKWFGYTGKPINTIVNIGVGGSDLGAGLAINALSSYVHPNLKFYFVSNVDGALVSDVLTQIDLETTLFIFSSKSFTTAETLVNATTIRQQYPSTVAANKHFLTITSNYKKACEFGFAPQNIICVGDWINGRYSLWSAMGLPIAIAIGMKNFQELLAGAKKMDEHFRYAPFTQNMPVILALLSIWYTNFFGAQSQAIVPYEQQLRALPAYLQQAHMESCGKQVSHQDGSQIMYATSPILWGDLGCNGQHAFHQLLHQGTHLVPVDFIIALSDDYEKPAHRSLLYANCLSQAQALMRGKTLAEAIAELIAKGYSEKESTLRAPHLVIPGNRPSNMLVFSKLTPNTLGALIALYEHKIFVQSEIWQINAFDQWGVELGKDLAQKILPSLNNQTVTSIAYDSSTQGLLNLFKSAN